VLEDPQVAVNHGYASARADAAKPARGVSDSWSELGGAAHVHEQSHGAKPIRPTAKCAGRGPRWGGTRE
jgi:hypothetical protein